MIYKTIKLGNFEQATLTPFSLERHVDSTTPPAFIWHTFTDKKSCPFKTPCFLPRR